MSKKEKTTMDETLKHRIVGVAVIVALVAIFAPVFVKTSNFHLRKQKISSFKIPSEPAKPKIEFAKVKKEFKLLRPVEVSLKKRALSVTEPQLFSALPKTPHITTIKKLVKLSTSKKITHKLKNKYYQIQLASFSREKNALKLKNILGKQGYKASVETETNSKGKTIAKVMVGKINSLDRAKILKKRLVSNTKLNGIIVSRG